MNATEVHGGYQPIQEAAAVKTMAGGAIMESFGALATIALAIVGLAGASATTMAAIATIVLGVSIWIEGATFAASHRAVAYREGTEAQTLEWGEGLGTEFLGGLSGIVLGILALLGVAPTTLLSIAALVFGVTFLFSSGAGIGYGSQWLFGLVGVVLGVLAVAGLNSLTLVLVALLCLGASVLFSGAAIGARTAIATRT